MFMNGWGRILTNINCFSDFCCSAYWQNDCHNELPRTRTNVNQLTTFYRLICMIIYSCILLLTHCTLHPSNERSLSLACWLLLKYTDCDICVLLRIKETCVEVRVLTTTSKVQSPSPNNKNNFRQLSSDA